MVADHESRQLARRRTRDYTIPVRLNQIAGHTMMDRRRVVRQLLVSLMGSRQFIVYLLALIVMMASMGAEQINCDSHKLVSGNTNQQVQAAHSPELPLSLAVSSASNQAISDKLKQSKPQAAIVSATNANNQSKRNRERLLAKLNENIERQHHLSSKFMPSFNFGPQRPSKFDSGEDIRQEIVGPYAGDPIKEPSSDNIIIRNIMRMHEQPIASSSSPSSSIMRQQSLHYAPNSHLSANELPIRQKVMPDIPMATRNGIVAQLLSYIIGPLMGTGSDTHLQSGAAPVLPKDPNISLPLLAKSARLYTGRSNTGTQNISSLASPATNHLLHHRPHLPLSSWFRRNRESNKPNIAQGATDSDPTKDDLMADSSFELPVATSAAIATSRWQLRSPTRHDHKFPLMTFNSNNVTSKKRGSVARPSQVARRLKSGANHLAQNYLQDSFRGLMTMSQLPILPHAPVSTAPSIFEPQSVQQQKAPGNRKTSGTSTVDSHSAASPGTQSSSSASSASSDYKRPDRRAKALEDLYRYAYILGSTMIGHKNDPLKALSTKTRPLDRPYRPGQKFTQRTIGQLTASNRRQMINLAKALGRMFAKTSSPNGKQEVANPRGVMWDMATDPTLAVTLMHLIERASFALPLGFLLMPIVQMIRNPLGGINLSQVLPPRASHRSVEHELLFKRLDAIDKLLGRGSRLSRRGPAMSKK